MSQYVSVYPWDIHKYPRVPSESPHVLLSSPLPRLQDEGEDRR